MEQVNSEVGNDQPQPGLEESALDESAETPASDPSNEGADKPADAPISAEAEEIPEEFEPAPPKLSPEQMLIMQLRAMVVDKEEKLKSYITAYKQGMADLEREKVRMAREREKVLDRERMGLCVQLLEVLDNLDRSRAGCTEGVTVGEVAEGLGMVSEQFLATLKSLGVERMNVIGEDFDHNIHEASGMIPAQGDQRDQEVLFEERAGYMFGDKLMRAARVVVAAKTD
jgi:molecular chaperone GrpE